MIAYLVLLSVCEADHDLRLLSLAGFASPHQKPFWVLSPDGELTAGSTSANGNDRGGGLGVHTAPSDDAARAAAMSEETFDVTIFDVRHPGGEGMQRLAQIHKINRLGRARHGFVWITPGLVSAGEHFDACSRRARDFAARLTPWILCSRLGAQGRAQDAEQEGAQAQISS